MSRDSRRWNLARAPSARAESFLPGKAPCPDATPVVLPQWFQPCVRDSRSNALETRLKAKRRALPTSRIRGPSLPRRVPRPFHINFATGTRDHTYFHPSRSCGMFSPSLQACPHVAKSEARIAPQQVGRYRSRQGTRACQKFRNARIHGSIYSRCTSFWRDSRSFSGPRSHCSNVDFPQSLTTRSRTSATLAASIPEAPRFQPLRASARFWRCHPSSSVALPRMIPLLHRVAIANRTVEAQALASVLLPDKHRPPQ